MNRKALHDALAFGARAVSKQEMKSRAILQAEGMRNDMRPVRGAENMYSTEPEAGEALPPAKPGLIERIKRGVMRALGV